jgi:sec-independent protein translocase protein TatC
MKVPFRRTAAAGAGAATPDDTMTLTEHLAELRMRVIRSMLAVGLGITLIMVFYDQVLDFLREPYVSLCARNTSLACDASLQFIDPLEGLSTRLSIATYGGIVLALPVIMWQLWRFIVPALHAKEKQYAIPFILSSVSLFLLGGVLAYVTLEKALEFLIAWAGADVEANFRVGKYISLVGVMVAAFGVAFQFPVLLVFLQLVGVISPQTLLKSWRYALMIIFVLAAVITPSGDPYSMLALAIPMSVFYLAAIGIGIIIQRRRAAGPAAA